MKSFHALICIPCSEFRWTVFFLKFCHYYWNWNFTLFSWPPACGATKSSLAVAGWIPCAAIEVMKTEQIFSFDTKFKEENFSPTIRTRDPYQSMKSIHLVPVLIWNNLRNSKSRKYSIEDYMCKFQQWIKGYETIYGIQNQENMV